MKNSSAWPADGIENIVRTYGNTLYRLCFVMLGNESDAEDAVQESFIKYLQKHRLLKTPNMKKHG